MGGGGSERCRVVTLACVSLGGRPQVGGGGGGPAAEADHHRRLSGVPGRVVFHQTGAVR